jgi:5-methylcytosine-specific restriction endonuclease McrA
MAVAKSTGRQPRDCLVCGIRFRPKGGSRVGCCSRTCGFEYQRRKRGAALKVVDHSWRAAICECCGTEYRRAHRQQRLCSWTCRRQQAQANFNARPVLNRTCAECRATFETRNTRRKRCGRRCAKRAARRREKRRGTYAAHRAKLKALPRDYSITNAKVFARDGWRCQLCGGRAPKRLAGSCHPLAPEVDHIIPLSVRESPGHVWSNVQCAHRKCNAAKHTRTLGQLRLL